MLALPARGSSVDRDIEDRVTITQGVYGQTTTWNDVSPGSFDYLSANLQVFAAPRVEGASPGAETTSDHAFTVSEGARLRRDYEAVERGWREGQNPD